MHAQWHTFCRRLDLVRQLRRPYAAFACVVVAILCGCGEVHFVPSPYTPQAVEALWSAQEQITIFRWRIAEAPPADDTQFELLGRDGYAPIDFSRSVFAGDVAACGDGSGSCAQYIVRGHAAFADGDRPIRAVHPTYGTLPGEPVTARPLSTTLSMDSFFRTGNDFVYVSPKDEVAAGGPYLFPRPYEWAMWPTSGLCVTELPPDGVAFKPLDSTTGGFAPEGRLTDSGIYCVASRPVPRDGGAAAMVQARVATLPEVVSGTQHFEPPTERAPVIYQIVLDLEIPIPDRCDDAIGIIENVVDSSLGTAPVTVRKLPTLNLATTAGGSRCHHLDMAAVPSTELADAVKRAVTSFPEVHQQFHFLYFNNLDSFLPRSLTDSLHALFDALAPPPGYDLQTLSWLFTPGSAAASDLTWWHTSIWKAADDPGFGQTLLDYADETFPYQSQLHDPGEPVALLSPSDTASFGKALIKICEASPNVEPLYSLDNPQTVLGASWAIDPQSPPAYLVTLQSEIAQPASSFLSQDAVVHYQVCKRYCVDHPYLSAAGPGVTSWATSTRCASQDH